MMELLSSAQVEQFLEAKLADREITGLIQQFALPYRELMAYYRCAMMEVSEKFHVLNMNNAYSGLRRERVYLAKMAYVLLSLLTRTASENS